MQLLIMNSNVIEIIFKRFAALYTNINVTYDRSILTVAIYLLSTTKCNMQWNYRENG
jgi:hypothetical protein